MIAVFVVVAQSRVVVLGFYLIELLITAHHCIVDRGMMRVSCKLR